MYDSLALKTMFVEPEPKFQAPGPPSKNFWFTQSWSRLHSSVIMDWLVDEAHQYLDHGMASGLSERLNAARRFVELSNARVVLEQERLRALRTEEGEEGVVDPENNGEGVGWVVKGCRLTAWWSWNLSDLKTRIHAAVFLRCFERLKRSFKFFQRSLKVQ